MNRKSKSLELVGGDELLDAILEYHQSPRSGQDRGRALYYRAAELSDTFLTENRLILEEQRAVALRYSHDSTSVFVQLCEHTIGLPMLKWIVCKPLGWSGAALESEYAGSLGQASLGGDENVDAKLESQSAFVTAVIELFWSLDVGESQDTLYQNAVLAANSFFRANEQLVRSQEWMLIDQGPFDLALLVSLGGYTNGTESLIWSPARVEAWYGVLPKSLRSEGISLVHEIAYNDFNH